MGKAENSLTIACINYMRLKGVYCWRQNNVGMVNDKQNGKTRYISAHKGTPDILGILPNGRFIGVEVKSIKGKQSEYQESFERNCKVNYGVYLLVRDIDEAIAMIDTIIEENT